MAINSASLIFDLFCNATKGWDGLKVCGFNQSETIYRAYAWRSPFLLTTARYGELIKMQQFCHQTQFAIESRITQQTKLYGRSTCGCNNNAIFLIEIFSRFNVCRTRCSGLASVTHAKVVTCRHCWHHYILSGWEFRFCLTTVSTIMIVL